MPVNEWNQFLATLGAGDGIKVYVHNSLIKNITYSACITPNVQIDAGRWFSRSLNTTATLRQFNGYIYLTHAAFQSTDGFTPGRIRTSLNHDTTATGDSTKRGCRPLVLLPSSYPGDLRGVLHVGYRAY
jgi:hypothetical protein